MKTEHPLKIEEAQLFHVKMPFRQPWSTSRWTQTHKECVIVRLRDASGLDGWGECVGDYPFYSYECVPGSWHILRDYVLPAVLAQPLQDIASYRESVAAITGHPMAKAGVEAALWDIAAQARGVSLQALLGGQGTRVRVGASVAVHDTPAKLLRTVDDLLGQGYGRIKLKIRKGKDLVEVAQVRAKHPKLPLQVDGNAAYTIDDIEHLKRLDEHDLLLIEQPLGNDDIVDHARLRAAGMRTPICLDESIHHRADVRKALELGAASIINIKPGRVGGLSEALAIHDYCLARDVPVWMGGMMETGIGRAANVALASLPGFTLAGDISASSKNFHEDIIERPFEINPDSTVDVPQGPGLGVKVNLATLLRVTEQLETFRA